MRKDKKDRDFFEEKDKGFWQTFFDENHKIPTQEEESRNRRRLYLLCFFILAVWFTRTFMQ